MKVRIFSSFLIFILGVSLRAVGLQPRVPAGRAVHCNLASFLRKDFHFHR